jgi:adenosylcobinamide kinase/adenosylcobinamide-phosphate guanylyltransferase
VAVHLGHRNPPTPELARRLAAWGARVVPDGTVLRTRSSGGPVPGRVPMTGRTLVLGGARSGKSAWAEAQLAAEPAVTYVATSGQRPDDADWAHRVALHRARRPTRWETVETTDLVTFLRGAAPAQPLLVDCATLWLTAVADECGVWESIDLEGGEAGGEAGGKGADKVADRCDELVAAWLATPARAFLVSNEVGSGVVPATAAGRWFRDELGRLNARLAAASDRVVLLVAGQAIDIKGDR